jgi:hypothetical protein
MSARRLQSVGLAVAIALVPFCNLPAAEPQQIQQKLITIGEETTVLTEPLDENGYVDYLAAVNKRLSEGVTPENNAAVLLRTALGLMEQRNNQAYRDQYDKMLGIEPVGDGLYVRLAVVASDEGMHVDKAYDQQSAAQRKPWVAGDFPVISEWLSANAAALELVVEATGRPRFYTPYIAGDASPKLVSVLLPAVQETREVARALSARAMWHAGEGDVGQAMRDLEALHRLARLVSQDPTIVGGLVGIAIDGVADHADVALVSSGVRTPEELRSYLERLNKLSPIPPMADRLDFIERLMFVDFVSSYARGEVDNEALGMMGVGGQGVVGLVQKLPQLLIGAVDWDAMLRDGNQWYDRIVAAMREPTFAEQAAALAAIDADVKSLAEGAKSPLRLAAIVLSDSKTRGQLVGKQIGDVLVSLLLPATNAAMNAEHRGQMKFDLSRLAVALEVYRATTGEYPESLTALTVDVLKEIPLDRYSGKPLRYERREDGYLLYSVGANAKDDGATSSISGTKSGEHVPEGEEVDSEAGDDLVVRVPLP